MLVAALALVAVIALAACGGDDEEAAPAPPPAAPAETEAESPEPTEAETGPAESEPPPDSESAPAESPEEAEGGAGDEEPARTLALFTGRGGRISPRVVRVPAFISVRVELRSGDGATYGLRFGDTTITAGGELASAASTIDGLRPGEAVAGVPTGAGNRVRIEATAEPGP